MESLESQRASWGRWGHCCPALPEREPQPSLGGPGRVHKLPESLPHEDLHLGHTHQITGLHITPQGEGWVHPPLGGAQPGSAQCWPLAPTLGLPGEWGVCDRACTLNSSCPPCLRGPLWQVMAREVTAYGALAWTVEAAQGRTESISQPPSRDGQSSQPSDGSDMRLRASPTSAGSPSKLPPLHPSTP